MFISLLNKYSKFLIVCGFVLFCPALLTAQKYTGSAITKTRLIRVISSREHAVPNIIQSIKKYGVAFKVTPAIEGELLAIKTKRQIIDEIKNNYRAQTVASTNNPGASKSNNNGSTRPNPAANSSASSGNTDTGEQYEELYYRGLQMIGQMRSATTPQQANAIANQIIEIGYQAIKIDRSRPEAYKLVGSGLIYNGNFESAEKFGQEALNRGGSLAFPVYHLSGQPHLEVLHVGKNYITVESNQKFFEYSPSEIMDLQAQANYNAPGGSVAVFGISTFKNNSPVEWYFSPANTGSAQEAQLIMRLIQKNAMSGR
jgi:hypothetical protein